MKGDTVHVLDHGRVTLLDLMGDDHEPARAARESYGHGDETRDWGPGPNTDGQLSSYLMRNRHTSPFEMVELKFLVRCPIFVARQWLRHRTANVNEYSMRYSPAIRDFHVPDWFRLQNTEGNKQGSQGRLDPLDNDRFRREVISLYNRMFRLYDQMIDAGVAQEQAREHLGLGIYTEFVWKIDLHNFLHFLELRTDSHAQAEIRVFADAMESLAAGELPKLMSLWRDMHPHG